jgi:hypothetical protein
MFLGSRVRPVRRADVFEFPLKRLRLPRDTLTNKFCGLSPRANYTDRETSVCQRD